MKRNIQTNRLSNNGESFRIISGFIFLDETGQSTVLTSDYMLFSQ